jgi:hypothetical protein
MGGQTKGSLGGEFFSFEKKRTHGCCGRLPWLFLLAFLIVKFSGFLNAHQGVFGLFDLILISDPPRPGMPFLDNDTCTEREGLFISANVFFLV